jgi:hypothetical protein
MQDLKKLSALAWNSTFMEIVSMKKLLLFFMLAAFCMDAHGQRIRLTDTTNTWRVYCDGGGTDYYSVLYDYAFQGDTTMYAFTYKRLAGTSRVLFFTPSPTTYVPPAGTYYLREDTIANMVWCRSSKVNGLQTDTAEHLIYNAAWTVNDTLRSKVFQGYPRDGWYISGIDSTQMAGQWYKVFKVTSTYFGPPNTAYFYIVEGMGATAGPGYAFTGGYAGEYNIQLQCFYNNGSKPELNPATTNLFEHANGTFSNAGPCNLAVNELQNEGSSFLSPNPANSSSKIVLSHSILEGRLIIYNSSGQAVSNTAISNTATVPLPAVLSIPGMYFYRVTNQKDGLSYTGRFVYK